MKKIFTLCLILSVLSFSLNAQIKISQIYGAGGNSGATYSNDYVELYNPTASAVSLVGWSVQYASATGTSWTNKVDLTGSIQPNKYYLISLASGGANGTALPVADFVGIASGTGSVNMSGSAGKVALVNSTTVLPASPVCPVSPSVNATVVDFVGFGTTATCYEGSGPTSTSLTTTTAAFRAGDGATDTDNNAADFSVAAPNPRNSAFVAPLSLKSFNASLVNGKGSLNWSTTNEINVNGFAIEKSKDGKNFSQLDFVAAKNTATNTYAYTDAIAATGTIYYRLKITDKDGSFKYSAIVALNAKQSIKLDVFPNPVVNSAILSHTKANNGATINVYTIEGKKLLQQIAETGATQSSIDVSKLTIGNYIVVFENAGTRTSTKFIKQ